MNEQILCYHCCFFSPTSAGRAKYNAAVPMGTYQEGVSGFCHRYAPQQGELLYQPNGDAVRGYSIWPKVFTHDWCGEFELRQPAHRVVDEEEQIAPQHDGNGDV